MQAAQLATLPLIHPWQGCLQQACWKGGRRAKSREIRREQIRQRIDAIHARIKELQRNGRTMLTLPRSANGSLRRSASWPPPALPPERRLPTACAPSARQPRPTSVPRCSMSELQRPGAVTRTSTGGKQQATGQPPQPLLSGPSVPDRCSPMKSATTCADQTRTRRSIGRSSSQLGALATYCLRSHEPSAPQCCMVSRRRA